MTTRPSRFPLGLLGALTLVAAVEAGIGSAPLRFADTASLSWHLSFEAARGEPAGRSRVACLGDSLVKIGVLPRVVEAATSLPTHNFAMGHAPAPATYFLLRRMLDAGHRPPTVVVDFKPSMLAGSPRFNLRQWQEVLRPAEVVELTGRAGGLGFLVEILLGQALPSYRDHAEIREAIAAAMAGRVAATDRTNRLAARNWGINAGAHLNGPHAVFDGRITPTSRRKLVIPKWECHRANAVYVEKFLALADRHKISVVWLIAPSSPELQTLSEQRGGDVAFARFVASAMQRHPRLAVVDARHAGYPTEVFADATHLNGRGAAALSHELGRLLTRPEDLIGRWVATAPFRDRAIGVVAEDIERSTAIIDAAIRR